MTARRPTAANDTAAPLPLTMAVCSIRAELADMKRAVLSGRFKDVLAGFVRVERLLVEIEGSAVK